MKLVLVSIIISILFVLIMPGILLLGIRKIPNGFQPSINDAQSVSKNISIRQTLKSRYNYFSGIGLTFKNPHTMNTRDLVFDLFDNQNQLIRTTTINGRNIADGSFVMINFEPVEKSEDNNFSFMLSAPDSESNGALAIYHSQQNPDDGGIYSVNNEQKNGQLAFTSYYSLKNPISSLITMYRNWFYKFLQDLPFAIFYFALIIVLVSFLIKNFRQNKIN